MKTLSRILLLFLLLAIFSNSNGQEVTFHRPSLFNTDPSVIPASIAQLDAAFNVSVDSTAKLTFGGNFSFTGKVISSVEKYGKLRTVLLRSSILDNTLFSISKRVNTDNTITYIAHIINQNYADGYELKKDDAGNYSFTKIRTKDLIQDY
jgi:hypothetical protein